MAGPHLLTTWDDQPGSSLNDYANRAWNGLVQDYYAMRWALYFDAQGRALEADRPLDQAAFLKQLAAAEQAWTKAGNTYPAEPAGEVIPAVRALREKYAPLLRDAFPPPLIPTRADVLGCWQYAAEGSEYLREFREDGTLQSYRTNGVKLPWFEGFRWRIEGATIVVERPSDGKVITHRLAGPGVLEFSSEGFDKARRVPPPKPGQSDG